MPKARPVYQYDMYGEFIREFSSISEAARCVEGRAENIRQVCTRKCTTSSGFQWRYKDEVDDVGEVIGLGNHKLDDVVKFLKGAWYSFAGRPFNPNDRRYNPDLEVHPPWKESFDNFYYDVIEDYKKFCAEFPEEYEDLKTRHSWFSRIDKNEGWTPENTKFMTPAFCVRHKDSVHKVIRDGRMATAQMIVDELESKGINVNVATILKRMRENRGLTKPSEQAKYKFAGEYYSLVALAEILDFDYDYVKKRINRDDESLKEAIKSYNNYRSYSYKDKKHLIQKEFIEFLCDETGLPRNKVSYRVKKGWSRDEILKYAKEQNTKD